jgi:hypothetical protein
VGDDGQDHDAVTVPQHRGIKGQMQGLAWFFPVLDRPQHQGAIERLNVDAAVAQPALTAPLPAGGQAMTEGQHGVPAVETDGLTQQQPGDHPAQQHQVAMVGEPDVLTQEGDQLTMQSGLGIHGGLDWFRSPKLPWLPAHPMS